MATHDEDDPIPAEFLAEFAAATEAARIADEVEPRARLAWYDRSAERVVVELKSGASYSFPVSWVASLAAATPEERAEVEVNPWGDALRWEALDEDVAVMGMLARILGPSYVYREFARTGGRSRSDAKAAAARENGRKGGRPRKTPGAAPAEVSYAALLAGRRPAAGRARETLVEERTPRMDEEAEGGREEVRYDFPRPPRKRKPRGG